MAFVQTHLKVEQPKPVPKQAKEYKKSKLAQMKTEDLNRHFFGNKAPNLKPSDLQALELHGCCDHTHRKRTKIVGIISAQQSRGPSRKVSGK
jgi:hypothetical protein